MAAAFILVMSVVALVQFAISQWRSMWIVVAEQPLSNRFETATGIAANSIVPEDFNILARAWEQLPAAPHERNPWLREVRIYYKTLCALSKSCERRFPSLAGRARRETVVCAKYMAAVLDQRLNAHLAYAQSPLC
ncbi:MAG TPA: hypothetical protein VJN21_11400 [Candidatus Acidoferrales bacterium]|nr:hypothetical protein [Candidatus Acidoferrales bacterium]